jgi:hypothetical protein
LCAAGGGPNFGIPCGRRDGVDDGLGFGLDGETDADGEAVGD